ncbi:MAG: hypothetical protein MH825_06750 [Cyanobacteria bacterium]|nr:hypothetical protein [Cyanobacteriota bacterium]
MRLPLPQFNHRDRDPLHIAEAIECSTAEYVAQCLEPEELNYSPIPAFGSWVRSHDEESDNGIYGVVYHVTTSPIDSVHRARALGMSLQELREEQPQIFSMLRPEFRVAIVGFVDPRSPALAPAATNGRPKGNGTGNGHGKSAIVGRIYQHLPPRPPQIHQSVYACTAEETIAFTEALDFLRTLLQLSGMPTDALIAATLREIYRLRSGDRPWLVRAGRALSVLLKDDYDRLRAILGQVHL